MLTDLQIFLVAMASVGGALLAACLGWLDSGQSFDARKFTSSLLRAVFAGLVFAAANYALKDVLIPWDYIAAILGGAGIDVLGNRISGAIVNRSKTEAVVIPAVAATNE